jgi:uncharacterized membrane protein YkvI
MSVETKCYQHVVIWADYAKALMKVEDERDEANRVCEQWRQWTVATRADYEALRARVAELEAVLRALRDAAEASDDSLYGTLGTGFVRSVVDVALGLSGNKSASLPEVPK